MKKALLYILAILPFMSQAQVLPLGAPTGLTMVTGSFKVDTFEQIPVINTTTKTRSRLSDSVGIIACDSTTHQLMYMANGTWAVVTGATPTSISTNQVFVDSNVTKMLAHQNADTGAVSTRIDSNKTFILVHPPAANYANWTPFTYGGVATFNARTGSVIPRNGDYVTDSVTEGINNLYFTTARAQTVIYSDTGTKVIATPFTVHDTALNFARIVDSTTKWVTKTQMNDSLNNYLKGNQSITLAGSVTGTGTQTINATIANSGVTAGTYNDVTVALDGRITSGSTIAYLTGNQTVSLSGEVHGYGATAIAVTVDSQVHIIGSTLVPSIAAGAGAGTGPTVSLLNATDISGYISVLTGTTCSASAIVVTVTFKVPFYSGGLLPKVVISPANAATAALAGSGKVYADYSNVTTNHFVLSSGATQLSNTTQYLWAYTVSQ